MSAFLLLALAFGQAQDDVKVVQIARISKDIYLTAIRELERAAEMIDSEPREAVAKISAVLSNPKIRNFECRLRIEVQPSIFEPYTFFPYQLRGRANMAVAKRAVLAAALPSWEAAIADLQKSVDAKVGGSAELLKEAKTGVETCKAAIKAAEKTDEPIVEFRRTFNQLISDNRFRSAANLVKGAEGQKLTEEERKTLNAEAEEYCQRFLEGRLNSIKSKLGDSTVKDLRDVSDGGFNRQFTALVPPEAELTESAAKDPALAWLRRHIKTLKTIQANQAKLEEVFAAASDALATDPADAKEENRWFRTMALLASELVEEIVVDKSKRAESLPKAKRAELQAESDKAHAAWKEFVEKTDKKVLERHPDLASRSEVLVEAAKGFPVELSQLAGYDIDACFLKEPGPELIKLENGLLELASKLSGRVAIESRQELYTKIINAGALRRFIQGTNEAEVIRELRRHKDKLNEAGGPINPGQYGPRVKKVFDDL